MERRFATMCMWPISLVLMFLALEYLLDGGDAIAVNLVSGRGASVREVINAARAVAGLKIDTSDVQRRPGDPSILLAEATLARNMVGWSAERSELATIIADAWRWHVKRFSDRTKASVTAARHVII